MKIILGFCAILFHFKQVNCQEINSKWQLDVDLSSKRHIGTVGQLALKRQLSTKFNFAIQLGSSSYLQHENSITHDGQTNIWNKDSLSGDLKNSKTRTPVFVGIGFERATYRVSNFQVCIGFEFSFYSSKMKFNYQDVHMSSIIYNGVRDSSWNIYDYVEKRNGINGKKALFFSIPVKLSYNISPKLLFYFGASLGYQRILQESKYYIERESLFGLISVPSVGQTEIRKIKLSRFGIIDLYKCGISILF